MNVVVTGASSGIGRALATTFARNGHAVLVVARREDRLAALCRELEAAYQVRALPLALDLTTADAAQTVFEHATRAFGTVHTLINNAGTSPYQKFRELSYRDLHQILSLNVQTLTELCYLFIPHMLAHGDPSYVVNVGSVGGYTPLPNFSVYSGTKHYVRIFTNLLHYEYRHTNVHICALHPGGTLTEFPEHAGQRLKSFGRRGMLTSEQVSEKTYHAVLKGKRVIIPGTVNQLAVLIGKLLPFPWAIRITELVYRLSVDQTTPR